MTTSIAIDGPAGAGKSTISIMLAKSLNYTYLDSGAMYRAVTLKALDEDIDIKDKKGLHKLVKKIDIDIEFEDDKFKIYTDGKDITSLIRKSIVDNKVSSVAKVKSVRDELIKKQRQIAAQKDIVMDGRDIGTRVLPEADFKFYLTASVDERAKRRYRDILKRGEKTIKLNEVKDEIKKRDKIDSNRKYSPLKKAKDAEVIDTTNLTKKEVLKILLNKIKGE